MNHADAPLVQLENLAVTFLTPRGAFRAVRSASLEIARGEVLGLVGESGCGKSTVAFAMMNYLPGTAQVEGAVRFEGMDISDLSDSDLRELRGNRIAMVYQDPITSLNPSMRVGPQIEEAIREHLDMDSDAVQRRAVELFDSVGLADPERIGRRYPHQLSGGQQQRVVIAMALACDPHLLIMDEPTTGLDVTTEATILDLIVELKDRVNAGILFVSHNLGVIARVADRVAVMYAGEIVEEAPVRELFKNPRHPYTVGLLSCVPQPPGDDGVERQLRSIPGSVFDAQSEQTESCLFAPRCPLACDECHQASPPIAQVADGHAARCFYHSEVTDDLWGELRERLTKPETDGALPVLNAEDLRKFYGGGRRKYILFGPPVRQPVRALVDVDMRVNEGRTLGIVGESGSGKSTAARAIVGLEARNGGVLQLRGQSLEGDVEDRTEEQRSSMRMVFQNPTASLNPKLPIKHAITRALRKFAGVSIAESQERAEQLMNAVGLDPLYLDRRPSELSGGQQQRVALASAFAAQPRPRGSRRSGVRSRCVRAGAGSQPAGAAPARKRQLLCIHHARPRRSSLCLRRHPCAVRRPRRGVWAIGSGAILALAPIYGGFALRRASARPGRRTHAHTAGRLSANFALRLQGLLLRRQMPKEDRRHLRQRAAARTAGRRRREPHHQLPHPGRRTGAAAAGGYPYSAERVSLTRI